MKPRVDNYSKLPFFSSKTFTCSPHPALAEGEVLSLLEKDGAAGTTARAGAEPAECAGRAAPSAASALKTAQKSLQPLFTVFFFL